MNHFFEARINYKGGNVPLLTPPNGRPCLPEWFGYSTKTENKTHRVRSLLDSFFFFVRRGGDLHVL